MRYQHDFGRGNAQGRNATFTAESQDSHELKDAPLRRSRGSSGGGPFGFGLSGGGAGGALRPATLTKHNKAAAAQLAAAGRLILPAVSYAYDRASPASLDAARCVRHTGSFLERAVGLGEPATGARWNKILRAS